MSQVGLTSRLPAVRGRYIPKAAMSGLTWFRAGGPADVLFMPADTDDLAEFLAQCPDDVPVMAVGVGSNLLVRDGGIEGVVVRLAGKSFAGITVNSTQLTAGAAVLDVAVAKAALDAGLTGLEFMRGIPGSVGGGLRMNAGAYGREFKDVLVSAAALDRKGRRYVLSNADMSFTYRQSSAPTDLIFVEAVFEGSPGDKEQIEARMTEITNARAQTQPIKSRTGGSTFKNPPAHKAWQLIDQAGCRGLSRGDAQVSTLHCNFLINHGEASGDTLEALGEEVRARVLAATGVQLEWEIKRIGRKGVSA